jgi:hypothetical protein
LCRLKLTTGGSLNHLGAQGRQSSKTVHLPKSLILREMQQKAVDREDTICTILLPAWASLESFGGHVEATLHHLGASLRHLGPSRSHFTAIGSHLEATLHHLHHLSYFAPFAPSCCQLGPAWNHLEAMLRLLCTIWEPACAILGHLETI